MCSAVRCGAVRAMWCGEGEGCDCVERCCAAYLGAIGCGVVQGRLKGYENNTVSFPFVFYFMFKAVVKDNTLKNSKK